MQRFHCKLYGITSYLFVATQKSCKKPWLGEKLFLLILSEILSPKTDQLRQAHKPGDILTQAVKQPYSKCLTRCVQRSTVGAVWTIWRWCQETPVDPQPCLPKYLCRVLSWCLAESHTWDFPSFVLADRHSSTANKPCTAKPDIKAS